MSDAPFMIGANGLIFDTSFNGMPPGYATVGTQPNVAPGESPNFGDTPTPGPWIATQLLPGALVQLVGGGQFNLLSTARSPMQGIGNGSNPQIGGNMGSIQVDVTVGALGGGPQGLGFLTLPAGNVPTAYLGIWVSSANQPSFTITDVNGVVQAVGAPSGSTIPAGTPLSIRLFWDATGTQLPSYVAFYSNGVAQPLGAVTGPWTPFQPASVLYGRGANGFGTPTFNLFPGRLNKFQAGNSPNPTTSPIQPAVSQTPP